MALTFSKTGMVKSIATTWCRGNTAETVYCHDICRGTITVVVTRTPTRH
jgi:hypothetical protein